VRVAIYDTTGREIRAGDVLRVFHFVGRRKKRHYMVKQVTKIAPLQIGDEITWYYISHLNRLADEPWMIGKNYFVELNDGGVRPDWEIIDSINGGHCDRPRCCTVETS
jgi:hypothetical protein